jgi:ABC-2 type transport system permease protein
MKYLRIELLKIFSKPRSFIGFAAITVIVAVIQLALYADGKTYWDFLVHSLDESFIIENLSFNGNMVGFIVLQTLIIQMPLLVALVAGDSVSGESQSGTIRSLITKPVSRTKILIYKFLAIEIYTVLLVIWLGLIAWVLSLFVFGTGDLVVLKSDSLVIIRNSDASWRFISAFFIAFLSLSVVSALSFFLSVLSENSISPIIITMSIIILFTIIGTFDIPVFDAVKPFLFTTHSIIWRNFFDRPVPFDEIFRSAIVLFVHIVGLLLAAIIYFNKKDIKQ